MTGPPNGATAQAALHVVVGSMPDAGLIRPALEAALAGRPFPDGPESAIARAVVDAVAEAVSMARPHPGGEPGC